VSSYPPYRITHVDLSSALLVPALASQGQGNYVVFWWKEVALGHVFLEPEYEHNEAAYWQALMAAIAPAVQQYAGKSGAPTAAWQTWMAAGDAKRWQSWMAAVFAAMLTGDVPRQVPVSVVICTRNRAATLRICLESLARMRCQPSEIVIVDNAPTDESTQQVVADYPSIRYCLEPTPGLSFARNTGVQQASHEIIAFTDDDVLLHPDWAFRVWESFQDEQVFAMTGLVLVSELDTEAQQIFEKHWSFNRGYEEICYDAAFMQRTMQTGPPVWEIGAGANSAFRKKVFAEVGLFDERLGAGASGCSEDSEMWFRILMGGHAIHYNPLAVVYHAHRKQLSDLRKQLFSYMRGYAAAALIQQEQLPEAGYTQTLYRRMPRLYAHLLKAGFPHFRFRDRTLWIELKGLASGVAFYYRHRRPAAPKQLP
jgi:glycosyltransferase involved in cell wall biosynthesis